MSATDPPLGPAALERLRLRYHRMVPSQGQGPHLRRRVGQSLEFRDFRDYQMGDDIRNVDWRATTRVPDHQPWVLRQFEAEERMTLAVIVDTRPAMRLPDPAPKLLFALWTLRALAMIAAAGGDAVILGTLFGQADMRPVQARGRAVAGVAARFADQVWAASDGDLAARPEVRTGALIRQLQPASAVVVLSDFLFDDPESRVARLAEAAQKSWRQLFLVPLDSLSAELAAARRQGHIRCAATEGRDTGNGVYEVSQALEAEMRQRVDDHWHDRFARWRGRGLVLDHPVAWPTSSDPDGLERLFMGWLPGSSVLSGVAARGGLG